MDLIEKLIKHFIPKPIKPKNELHNIHLITESILTNYKNRIKYDIQRIDQPYYQTFFTNYLIGEIFFNLYNYSGFEDQEFLDRIKNNTTATFIVVMNERNEIQNYSIYYDYKDIGDYSKPGESHISETNNLEYIDFKKENDKLGIIICDYKIDQKNPHLKRKIQSAFWFKEFCINQRSKNLKFIVKVNPRSGKICNVTSF